MLEETIDASPSRLNCSLRKKRMHRKTKSRRSIKLATNTSITPSIDEENTEMVTQLLSTFWDSESDENVRNENGVFQKLNNFERFKEENMLAAADQSACPILRSSQKPTQMFQTCDELLQTQPNLNATEYLSCKNEVDAGFEVLTEWMQASFEIKEETHQSQDETLKPTPTTACDVKHKVDSCDDVLDTTFLDDVIFTQQASAVQRTANRKNIVDDILEDFCASLSSSSDDDESKSVDFEPYIRFRKRKIRTYERCFRRRIATNIARASPLRLDDIELSDTSSELSVQENKTQITPAFEPFALDLSGAVHNNLLNLSAFFTQKHESHVEVAVENVLSSTASKVDDHLEQATDIVEFSPYNLYSEIHTLRLKNENFAKPILCKYSNDLLGFASIAEYEMRSAQRVAEPFEGSIKDTSQVSKVLLKPASDEQTSQSKGLIASTAPVRRSMDRITAPVRTCDSEPDIFDEKLSQDYSEFFSNFKTQATLNMPELKSEIVEQVEQTDQLDSQADIIELFEQPKENVSREVQIDRLHSQIYDDDVIDAFLIEPFTQLVKQEDLTSIDCQPSTSKQAAAIIANQQYSTAVEENATNHSPENSNAINNLKPEIIKTAGFIGFQTASRKPINISEKAQKKYQNFFDEVFNEDDFKSEQTTIKSTEIHKNEQRSTKTPINSPKKLQPAFNTNIEEITNSKCLGFQTASYKPISISKKAQKKYEHFFDEILKEDDSNVLPPATEHTETKKLEAKARNQELSAVNDLPKEQPSTSYTNTAPKPFSKCLGFQTASCKPISISEKAQKKYVNFFEEILQEDEFQPTNQIQPIAKCEDNFENIQLSEWILDENSPKKQQQTPKIKTNVSPKTEWPTKRKFKSLENSTDTTTCEQPIKKLCKSYTLNDISAQTPKTANLRTSISHMPTTSTKKNLLSLTKRQKSKLKHSLIQNNNNELSNVETPVKLVAATKLAADLMTTALYTPNATDFYAGLPDAVSTPQAQSETPNRRLHALRSADNLESDFKRINWEQLDDGKTTLNSSMSATTPTRTKNASLNGTLIPLPSPQERIENLSACGDPPPLPQIVRHNTSRRSLGLCRFSRKS